MAEIQTQIDADRRKLETQKDMEEEEKTNIEQDLHTKEGELKEAMYVRVTGTSLVFIRWTEGCHVRQGHCGTGGRRTNSRIGPTWDNPKLRHFYFCWIGWPQQWMDGR